MNAEELLEQYAADRRDFSGLNFSGATLTNANLSGANLSRVSFNAAKLTSTDLSYANCQRTTFHGAKLTLTDFSHADLTEADFSKSDLTRADFSAAILSCANLSYADLRDAKLRCATLGRANLNRVDLRYAKLVSANLAGANLTNSDLGSTDFSGADLRQAELRQVNLNRANLQGANLSGANLRWADLSGANLRWADLTGAKLSGANLTGADLSHATLLNATLVHVDLSRSNLAFVDWAGADLSGSTLTGAKLHAVAPFGVTIADVACRWIDLSQNGDQSVLYEFLSEDLSEYFHPTPPIVELVIDDRLTPDAHCALAVAYQQLARQGHAIVPPRIEIYKRRTLLKFELERDDQLFLTAFLAVLPFADAQPSQRSLLNLLQSVPTQAMQTNGLQQFHQLVTALSQSIQKLDTAKLLQAIPIAIKKIRFFQAPTRSTVLNSSARSLTIYDHPQFGKRRIQHSQSEEEFAFLTQPVVFVPPTPSDAIEFLQGFHLR